MSRARRRSGLLLALGTALALGLISGCTAMPNPLPPPFDGQKDAGVSGPDARKEWFDAGVSRDTFFPAIDAAPAPSDGGDTGGDGSQATFDAGPDADGAIEQDGMSDGSSATDGEMLLDGCLEADGTLEGDGSENDAWLMD